MNGCSFLSMINRVDRLVDSAPLAAVHNRSCTAGVWQVMTHTCVVSVLRSLSKIVTSPQKSTSTLVVLTLSPEEKRHLQHTGEMGPDGSLYKEHTGDTHARFLPALVAATPAHCFCLLTAAALSCTLVRITETRLALYCSLLLRAVTLPLLRQVTQSNARSEGLKPSSRRSTLLCVAASLQSGNEMWHRRTGVVRVVCVLFWNTHWTQGDNDRADLRFDEADSLSTVSVTYSTPPPHR